MDHHYFLFKQAAVAGRLARAFPGSIMATGAVNPAYAGSNMPSLLRRALSRATLRLGAQENPAGIASRIARSSVPDLGAGPPNLLRRMKAFRSPQVEEWLRLNPDWTDEMTKTLLSQKVAPGVAKAVPSVLSSSLTGEKLPPEFLKELMPGIRKALADAKLIGNMPEHVKEVRRLRDSLDLTRSVSRHLGLAAAQHPEVAEDAVRLRPGMKLMSDIQQRPFATAEQAARAVHPGELGVFSDYMRRLYGEAPGSKGPLGRIYRTVKGMNPNFGYLENRVLG